MNLEELRKNHNVSEKELKEKKTQSTMYYGKLEELFDEICKSKSLDKEELKQQMIKEFVEKHKNLVSEKYYLKYYGDKDEILIFGDDGKYYELSDGSRVNKRTFEKMFKSEKTGDIEINPYDFFNYNAINIKTTPKVEKPIEPINMKDFDQNRIEFANKIKKFFENIDVKNMKEPKKDVNVKVKTPIYNNEPVKHNQNEEWKRMAKDKLKKEREQYGEGKK